MGGWLIWKTIWYDWSLVAENLFLLETPWSWAVPPVPALVLTIEKWVLIALLGMFIVGYRVRLLGGVSALLLAHLAVVRYNLNTSGETQALMIGVYFLIFFSIYAETDELSLDGIRRTKELSLDELRSFLKTSDDRSYDMPALKWSLLVIAIIYFGAGFDKVFPGPRTDFATAENLSRIITIRHFQYAQPFEIGPLITEYPILAAAAGWGTLVLELGFLPAVLAGVTITPFAVGILGFTASNAIILGIHFADMYFVIGMLVAWDLLYQRVASDRSIDLVFDEHCYFCMQSLYPFKLLDINDTVNFHSQYDIPMEYKERDDVDFESAMYVFRNGTAHEGYYAFRELLRQFRIFFWAVWLMEWSIVERIGVRIYRYIAANRGRHFTCRVEEVNSDLE
ncbi:DCC1-like thiol-disulfide oxidoreductase family protein [Halalkalicoccus salilacus]|uniref:DCC1-like thiol-disulfide oxidoreductase family protein n=1 Tax=Halalkalicoccus sp. GCM10025704 TaxID=3252662 RepID=UPI0036F1F4D0